MIKLLIGLESALLDDQCERVELHDTRGQKAQVYTRQGEDSWVTLDPESDSLHTRRLRETIDAEFGRTCDELACFVRQEKIVYSASRGAVRMRREPRTDLGGDEAAEHAQLEAITNALGIAKSKRGGKIPQALQFSRVVEEALSGKGAVRVLDLACGRSYLGFVLMHLLASHGREARLHGVDSNPALVDKCREITAELGWTNTAFETADLAQYSVEPDSCDVLVSLHGCDTLSDEAIRVAVESRVPLLFVAPCCQQELRNQWRRHPLQWISRYGLLEQRLADVLTDGFRCLVLEAMGYRVRVLRFVAAEITPKNLILEARLSSSPDRERAQTARAFMKRFGVRPRIAELLDTVGAENEAG